MKTHVIAGGGAGTVAAAMACMAVALYVHQPSSVAFTAHEVLRLDHLAHSAVHGDVAEQYGDLLGPGTSTVHLEPGVYHFRSVGDVSLTVARGGAVKAVVQPKDKDPWPDPKLGPFDTYGLTDGATVTPCLTVVEA